MRQTFGIIVLLIFMFNAALVWRVSRQTIGNPTSVKACQNQFVFLHARARGLRLSDYTMCFDCRSWFRCGPDLDWGIEIEGRHYLCE